jgi:hypothetical protein
MTNLYAQEKKMMNPYCIRANTKQEQRIKLSATLILMEFALDDASNLHTFDGSKVRPFLSLAEKYGDFFFIHFLCLFLFFLMFKDENKKK